MRFRGAGIGPMLSPGIGSGGKSWSPSTPLDGETPSLWVKTDSRDGLEITDSLGGTNLVIQLPYLDKPTGDEYARIQDNGALDIAASAGDFTYYMWVKGSTASNPAVFFYFGGKGIYGSVNGQYSFNCSANSKYQCSAQSSGGAVTISSEVLHTDQAAHLLLLQIDKTAKKISFFIDNVQIGVDTSYTGDFAAVNNVYGYITGAGHTVTTGVTRYPSKSAFSDTGILHRKLTPTEKTNLYNRILPTGHFAQWDNVLREDNLIRDFSGNGYNLTGTNLLKSTKAGYGAMGSRQGLNVGYSLFTNFPNKEIQIPYTPDGVPFTGYTIAGYTKDSDNVGSLTTYNLADSYLQIAGIDRSDTTKCSYLARHTDLQHYYKSTQVSWIHSAELKNLELSNYFNDDYRGLRFLKVVNRVLTDLVIYTTNKIDLHYEKAIKWTGELGLLKFDVIVTGHVVAVNGSKMLMFDDIDTLSLSYDYGVTFPVTKVLTGISNVEWGAICDDGKIGFVTALKCYYSHDDLMTYHESTVTDAFGHAFEPYTDANFCPTLPAASEVVLDGTKMWTWGNYATVGTAEYNGMNQWYTKDGFQTVKSGYLFGVSTPTAVCRHIHWVEKDPYTDYLWMGTGDNLSPNDNIMRGTYDSETDTFLWQKIGAGGAGSIWENTGLAFDENYYYPGGEDNYPNNGFKRLLRSNMINWGTAQVPIFFPETSIAGLTQVGGYTALTHLRIPGHENLTFTKDMVNFITRKFLQVPLSDSWGAIMHTGYMSNGYFVFKPVEVGQDEKMATKCRGHYLLIKPSEII
jgi:hypothetical protein